MQGIQGAVWEALALITRINSDGNFSMAGLWDIMQDNHLGAIGGGGSALTNIDPQGWFLSRAGQYLTGSQIAASATHSNELAIATGTANAGTLAIVNNGTDRKRIYKRHIVRCDVYQVGVKSSQPQWLSIHSINSIGCLSSCQQHSNGLLVCTNDVPQWWMCFISWIPVGAGQPVRR
jgi:hypothetical protein